MSRASDRGPNARWWERFFDASFAELWLSDDSTAAGEARVAGLLRVLALRPGRRVFDQCCGVGRLAAPLVARGVHVVGVDGVATYVATARERCAALPPDGRGEYCFVVGDALEYVPPFACDAAINWHTSFGYAPDDHTNLAMLRCAFGALVPGGRFLLDYPDMEHVRAHFRPVTERVRHTPAGTYRALREARLDEARQMLVDRWTFTHPDGSERACWGETRLYSPSMLRELLLVAGFEEPTEVDPEGLGYAPDAGRSVWLARRPSAVVGGTA